MEMRCADMQESAARSPRSNDRLKRVVIVGQIVTGNLHRHAVEADVRTLSDRLGEGDPADRCSDHVFSVPHPYLKCRLAYRVMFDQTHKWWIVEFFGSTVLTHLD